ncbi:hypothetical protein [Bacteroides sp. 224]|uniref:hypothetical protein n=1 Tax=Bacteroides sp. 224 TaxID=2302936 RepID=UPI0013D8901A|nr:hypothetical protein [Bacteroides sp. 224]
MRRNIIKQWAIDYGQLTMIVAFTLLLAACNNEMPDLNIQDDARVTIYTPATPPTWQLSTRSTIDDSDMAEWVAGDVRTDFFTVTYLSGEQTTTVHQAIYNGSTWEFHGTPPLWPTSGGIVVNASITSWFGVKDANGTRVSDTEPIYKATTGEGLPIPPIPPLPPEEEIEIIEPEDLSLVRFVGSPLHLTFGTDAHETAQVAFVGFPVGSIITINGLTNTHVVENNEPLILYPRLAADCTKITGSVNYNSFTISGSDLLGKKHQVFVGYGSGNSGPGSVVVGDTTR